MPRIHHGPILPFRPATHSDKPHRHRIPKSRIRIQHTNTDIRCTPLFPLTRNHPITNDPNQFPTIAIIRRSNTFHRSTYTILAFTVAGDEADCEEFGTDPI